MRLSARQHAEKCKNNYLEGQTATCSPGQLGQIQSNIRDFAGVHKDIFYERHNSFIISSIHNEVFLLWTISILCLVQSIWVTFSEFGREQAQASPCYDFEKSY